MSRADLLLACALVAGCTVLRLDDVVSDFDHDGVADPSDVCPRDYDPLQTDSNADGVGDACGPCGTSTQDLDGDGRDDGCDACIGAGAIGVDMDADGIDDGCDSCVDGADTTGLDLDLDGIPDGCDSCIATGFDGDSDGVDDACDICLFGANNDEDLDGLADGCDVCPADRDPEQAVVAPETDIGVACDAFPDRDDARRLFDGFGVMDEGIWTQSPYWQTYDGAAHVVPSFDNRSSFYTVRGDFVIRTFVRFAPGADPGGILGVAVSGSNGLFSTLNECGIDPSGTLRSTSASQPTVLDVSQGVLVRLTRIRTAQGDGRGTCEATDHAGTHAIIENLLFSDVTGEQDLSLIGRGTTGQYDWVEALDHPLLGL